MSVKLREKTLSDGRVSFYLDIYHNGKRTYDVLKIYYNPKKPSQQDKENKRLAMEIRAKREHDLIVKDNGLIDKKAKMADFIDWLENTHIPSRGNNSQYTSALFNLKLFMGAKAKRIAGNKFELTGAIPSLPFAHITPQWLNAFKAFLLKRVSNNSARSYMKVLYSALKEAERIDIIPKNPFRLLEKTDWLEKQDVFRTAWDLTQLQQLADTPCDIDEQIKQAYFFSCFQGLRWSDTNGLKWIDFSQKKIKGKESWFIHFRQKKTGNIEYIPLSDQAVYILKERTQEAAKEGDKSPYVFPRIVETDQNNKIVQRRVNRGLKKWATEAGLNPENIHFHTGRHTFATNVLESSDDGDLATVQKLLGHRSIQATQIYAKVRDRKKASAIASLPTINLKKHK